MANFNEHALELSIMELFKDEGYTYLAGEQIHRERTEVLLADDLRQYLYNRYAKDGITPGEVDGILLRLRTKRTRRYINCCATVLSSTVRTGRRRIYILSSSTMTIPKTISSRRSISLKSRAWAVSFASPTALCSSTVFPW